MSVFAERWRGPSDVKWGKTVGHTYGAHTQSAMLRYWKTEGKLAKKMTPVHNSMLKLGGKRGKVRRNRRRRRRRRRRRKRRRRKGRRIRRKRRGKRRRR